MDTCDSQQDETQESLGSTEGETNLRHRKAFTQVKHTLSAASRLLRRKIPCSGHFMTSRRLWLQSVPTQDSDVVLTFPPGVDDSTLMWLISRLKVGASGLVVHVRHHASSDCYGFYITAPYNVLLKVAEEIHLPKRVRNEFGGGLKEFVLTEAACFEGMENENTFFSSQERQYIVLHVLHSLRAVEGDEVGNLRLIAGQSIIPKCLSVGIISQVFPLHEPPALEKLQKSWVRAFFEKQPLDSICDYFGVKIAMYFAWLGHYTTALIVPAVVGFVFWVGFCGADQALEDVGFVLFSFFNVLWASIYLEAWKRYSAELAYRWGTLDQRDELLVEPRPLFTGPLEVSPVTGRLEPTYPAWKRNVFRYFVSVPIICLCLSVVFVVMFLILQLQDWWDKKIEERSYPFFLSYLPKILLAVVITLMDEAYHKVACWLNDRENYRLDTKYENHLIVKVALFQFVNSFLSLFYIAFYLQDQEKLKEQLAALLIARQVIGNIKESALPYLLEQFRIAKLSFDLFGALSPSDEKKDDSIIDKADEETSEHDENTHPKRQIVNRSVNQAELESTLYKYDGTFEDHLEMFIQFGYVVLFSSAFPMAGLCALLNNVIEIRSDAFKLCFIFQRPFGQRVPNIGTWQDAMEVMGLIAVLVNCALIGLSGQVHRMFPEMSTTQTILLIVILEHIMLILRLVITYAIPDLPEWVATEMAKVEFSRREAFRRFSSTTPPPATDGITNTAVSASPNLVIGRFVVSPASSVNSTDEVEDEEEKKSYDRKSSNESMPSLIMPVNEAAPSVPTEEPPLMTVKEVSEESPVKKPATSPVGKSALKKSKEWSGSDGDGRHRRDGVGFPGVESSAPIMGHHLTIGPHGVDWVRRLVEGGRASSGRGASINGTGDIGSLPDAHGEFAIRHSTDCIVPPKELSASSDSDLLRSAPPWVDQQRSKFRFSPEKDKSGSLPSGSPADSTKTLSSIERTQLINEGIRQRSGSTPEKPSEGHGVVRVRRQPREPVDGPLREDRERLGAKPKVQHMTLPATTPTATTPSAATTPTVPVPTTEISDAEKAAAELAAKKSRVKRSLLKRARSVAIFSLKLKERRARDAQAKEGAAAAKEANNKENSSGSMKKDDWMGSGCVEGELSRIPIEKLISVDDVAVERLHRRTNIQ
ncbi:anoctamin-8 [Ischnura elegans]|uniref:anoctamin-8 n=1 Tax=Ischnura elegans TaxID=197161 RepID=UPI001ED8A946|nr:anoctamin-8 [Ischnura elegans]